MRTIAGTLEKLDPSKAEKAIERLMSQHGLSKKDATAYLLHKGERKLASESKATKERRAGKAVMEAKKAAK